LAREGADVMLVDLCDNIPSCDYPLATSEDLDRTACMIEKLNRTVAVYRCDVCDRAEMEVAVDAAVRQLGALDVVVANAAIAPIRPEAPIAAFIDTFDVDFIGVVNTFSAAMPRLSAGASLIASGPTCSPQGPSLDRPQGPGAAAYELAQSMVSQYVKTLAKQVAPQGIRVNTVSGAENAGGDSERAKIDRLCHDCVLAFGRRFEWQNFDLVTGRHELIVEIRRDGMDQLQRTSADEDRLALGPYDRGGSQKASPQSGNKVTTAYS